MKLNKHKPVYRTGEFILKILGIFVIFEPVWMLLPFAGFLYGSCLHIQTLSRYSTTAWLTHFVFPVLTLGPVGSILVVVGVTIFLVGAGQIYWSKLRGAGLVTNGLYTHVRHPQYTALVLFGVGVLLAWGRAITFLAFFVMMFLYYYLAKSEEQKCLRMFGKEYEIYQRFTSFCIPGDESLAGQWCRLPCLRLPPHIGSFVAFTFLLLAAFSLIWVISGIRTYARTVPFLTMPIQFPTRKNLEVSNSRLQEGRIGDVPFVTTNRILVVRGPWRNAASPGFAEEVLRNSLQSSALADFLGFIKTPSRHVAIVFCGPFTPPRDAPNIGRRFLPKAPTRRGPESDPDGPDRARLIIMHCKLLKNTRITEAVGDKSKRTIVKICVVKVDLSRPAVKDFVVEGPWFTGPGCQEKDLEERWDYLMRQLATRESLRPQLTKVPLQAVPEPSASTDLVLVQAPILLTRLEPRFAWDILNRLVGSPCFCNHIKRMGAGGEVVPVAFPRPGPNWYSEYHIQYKELPGGNLQRFGGSPQVSIFVMLVHRNPGLDLEEIFDATHQNGHKILGAFIAELDFAIQPPADPVHEIVTVGSRCDLKERWDFFLSGL